VLKEYVYGSTGVQKIKRVAKSLLGFISPLASRGSGGGRLAVFYFHQLLADSTPANDWRRILGHLTVSELRSRLLLAQRDFKFVDFSTFLNLAERYGSLDQNYALLTVDDAFRDFLTNAVPLLEELSIPSLLSVSSQAASTGTLWYQRVYDLIAGISGDRLYVPWMDRHIYWGDQQSRVFVAENELLPQLKRMKPQRRLEFVDELIKRNAALDPADDLSAFCTVKELRTLQRFPFVQLCLHGDAHHPFETLSDEELTSEVQACQRFFQDQLDSRTTVLCFPNGRFKQSQAPVLQDLGIRYAFVTAPGGWVTQKAFPFSIPRNGLTGGSAREFRRRLARFVYS
jgi:peptidoglycan/xylan/chitin deacetylase (PgdA/CDA1 family)